MLILSLSIRQHHVHMAPSWWGRHIPCSCFEYDNSTALFLYVHLSNQLPAWLLCLNMLREQQTGYLLALYGDRLDLFTLLVLVPGQTLATCHQSLISKAKSEYNKYFLHIMMLSWQALFSAVLLLQEWLMAFPLKRETSGNGSIQELDWVVCWC